MRVKGVITGLAVAHLGITLWHGNAHQQLGITLPIEKNVFVYAVIVIAPIVASFLVWFHRDTLGVWLFFLSMLGSLFFGVYHHYVLISADNIQHLPAGSADVHAAFITSAGVLALAELGAVIYGAFCLGLLQPRQAA